MHRKTSNFPTFEPHPVSNAKLRKSLYNAQQNNIANFLLQNMHHINPTLLGHRACAALLLAKNARRDLLDADGMSAAMLARKYEHDHEFVKILE
jgi:hypothetical protein